MAKNLLVACSFAVLIAAGAGCCVDRAYRPSQCDARWDRVLGSCNECGSCGGDCEGHTPCQALKHSLTCSAGCGEIYWGEWTSDPPDECDPCDNCGNWVGPTCCAPAWWERFKSGLSGWRFTGGDCCEGGMREAYAGEYEYESAGEMVEGEIIPNGPTPAPGRDGQQEQVPAPNGSAPPKTESIQKQPKPAIPEPMPELQTGYRGPPQRRAPNLLSPNGVPGQRHPASVLARSQKLVHPRPALNKSSVRQPHPNVKQAGRHE